MTEQAGSKSASDENGKALRRDMLRALGTGLETSAPLVQLTGHLIGSGRVNGTSPRGNGDDGLVAVSYVLSVAASLTRGIEALLGSSNVYAAAALVRQLVEVEYLAWACAEDTEEAADWFNSSAERRRARWQPRHLRERSGGRFRAKDYGLHCELGGHPTPRGVRSFLLPLDLELMCEMQYLEAIVHTSSIWQYVTSALAGLVESLGLEVQMEAIEQTRRRWLAADQLRRELEELQLSFAEPEMS